MMLESYCTSKFFTLVASFDSHPVALVRGTQSLLGMDDLQEYLGIGIFLLFGR